MCQGGLTVFVLEGTRRDAYCRRRLLDIPIDLATRRVIRTGTGAEAWREGLARTIRAAIANVVEDYSLGVRTR